MTGRRRLGHVAVLVVATATATAACGGEAPAPPETTGPVRTEIAVGLTEWDVETGGARAAAGEVTLRVTNAGATAHDLVVTGSQGTWRTPVLSTGEQAEMVVTTSPGEVLALDCSITGHHQQGMFSLLQVASDA